METTWPLIAMIVLFVIMLFSIAKDSMDRSSLVIIIALLSYLVVVVGTGAPLRILLNLMFGTEEDGYQNFHTILLIFGISIITFFCQYSGLFQFLSFKVIQATKGHPGRLMIMNSMLTFFVSAVLADQITAIIMIPLTITICRTLKLNPVPFIIIQAMFIKIGATVLPISSVPTIMITSNQGIGFLEYLSFSGVISILLAFSTAVVFAIKNRKKFSEPKGNEIENFLSQSPWAFVKDKSMMLNITTIFLGVIALFIIIPSDVISPDIIAMMGAGIALFVNRKHGIRVMKDMDFDLLIYLLSVFVVSGCLEAVGVIKLIGEGLQSLNIHEPALAFLLLLWVGAICSAFVDNIPIAKILLSMINVLMGERGSPNARLGAMGLSLGIIWGDNLTPFGDTLLAIGVAQNHNVKIEPKEFGKVSATTTLIQLIIISLIILGIFVPEVLVIELIVGGILLIVFLLVLFLKKNRAVKVDETNVK